MWVCDADDSTYAAQTTAAGFLADHTRACPTWQETEKTDGSRGMHRCAGRSLSRSRSDTHTAPLSHQTTHNNNNGADTGADTGLRGYIPTSVCKCSRPTEFSEDSFKKVHVQNYCKRNRLSSRTIKSVLLSEGQSPKPPASPLPDPVILPMTSPWVYVVRGSSDK